jgi:hypothetical protein
MPLASDNRQDGGVVDNLLMVFAPIFPDFNPIENMWRKIKQILRSLAMRTGTELLAAAAQAFCRHISVADCQGFFFNAQYAI